MSAARDERHALLAMVHIAKKELRLDDVVYRAVLQREFAVNSSSELTIEQLERLVWSFEAKGWKRKQKTSNTRRSGRASPSQLGMIRGIWNDLVTMDRVRDPSERALRRFVKRVAGVDSMDWLTPAEAGKVIEGLKAWRTRERDHAVHNG